MEVDIDQILDVALRGVRRASMFMGLGVNAALDERVTEHQLTSVLQIQLIPEVLSPDQLVRAKDEFKLWIEANGFRELIETFHVFLDEINLACLKLKLGQKEISVGELKASAAIFAKQGFPNKLNLLKQNYGIESAQELHLLALNGARNVLTHRLTIVQQRDVNADGLMLVSWLGVDVFVEESNGIRHLIEAVIEQGKSFPEETNLFIQFTIRTREFRAGERLAFSSRDLAEVCWFMSREAQAIVTSLIEHAKRIGIEIRIAET